MQRNPPTEERGRVLRFERPGQARRVLPPSPVADIGKYEQAGEPAQEPDDYRHRQMVNAAALAVCVLLVVTGVWLADKIAELRRDQDCVLAGRRNCAQISIFGPGRDAAFTDGRAAGRLSHD